MKNAAQHVIEKVGGPEAAARLAGVSVTQVYRWTYPRERGGTGGLIPARHQQALLEGSKILRADDFFQSDSSE